MDLQQETLRAVSVLSPYNNPNPGLFKMEHWKDIDGYEGKYQISNLGNVKSLHGIGMLLTPYKKKNGYLSVKIIKNGKYKHHMIHRLVALAFVSNPKSKPNINHIDFNQTNNIPSNLEWCTQRENIWHTVNHGRNNPTIGETHPSAKLKESDVIKIRKMVGSGISQRSVAKIYNVTSVNIGRICNRKIWKHI